jgi:hypothetical protein
MAARARAVETPKINLVFREGKLPIAGKGHHFAKYLPLLAGMF